MKPSHNNVELTISQEEAQSMNSSSFLLNGRTPNFQDPISFLHSSDFTGNLRRQFYYFASNSVSIAALLRRYSPSPHPLLRLLSHVTFLLSLTIRLCHAKVVNFTRLYLGGQSRLLGSLNSPRPCYP